MGGFRTSKISREFSNVPPPISCQSSHLNSIFTPGTARSHFAPCFGRIASMKSARLLASLISCLCTLCCALSAATTPNIIYIMDDELGYYEPGFMGGRTIQTPNLDRMAAEGIRFNNLYAGSCVCAPTRCCFLTGKHSGHPSVRSNGGGNPMRVEEVTIASMLKPLGYATGGFGKWGWGGRDSSGVPEKHGFDVFLGYYDQIGRAS